MVLKPSFRWELPSNRIYLEGKDIARSIRRASRVLFLKAKFGE
jgi:hypothetical protein